MPIPTERPSTITNLEQRYDSQHAGGAFDAKQVGKTFLDAMNNEFALGFTKGGIDTGLPRKDSSYLDGHSTEKYKA